MTADATAIKRVLNGLTVTLVAVGFYFWFKEPAIPRVSIPQASEPTARASGAADTTSSSVDATAIVASNMFSASRAAPSARYTPSGGCGMSGDASDLGAQSEPVAPASPPPRAFVTMTA